MEEEYIPLSVPNLKGNELSYVTDAVKTEWVSTAGSYVSDFEMALANYVGVDSAVACQSGTAGIHVAMMLAGVGAGDLVIVPTLTFIAAVNPVRYMGADPIFMDCDESLCMDPKKLERFCEEECSFKKSVLIHNATGKTIRALVVVHVFGNMADMEAIMPIAKKFNLAVIEDATEALGTRYEKGVYAGRYTGTIGDVGVYSFNGNKIITTGGGGMIVSNYQDWLDHAKHLTTQAKSDPTNYEHDEIGYNYRLTNLQAALGLAQIEQLDTFVAIKNKNWDLYAKLLADIPNVNLLPFRQGIHSNKWFYSLLCDEGIDRDTLIQTSSKQRIQTRPIWGLIHQQTPYRDSITYRIEEAPYYRDHIVNIPCSTNLTEGQIQRVVEVLKEVTNHAD